MLKSLPLEVDYQRVPQGSGKVIYIFSHPNCGVLGSLQLVPHDEGSRIVWSPSQPKEHSSVQTHLEDFMVGLIEELQMTVKSLYQHSSRHYSHEQIFT